MRQGALLVAGLLAACTPSQQDPSTSAQSEFEAAGCRVQRVVDGDTIAIACPGEGARKVRLTGFDTPETYRPRCAAERARGQQATRHLRTLVARAETVALHRNGVDRYGRLLGRLVLDSTDIARHMVSEGLAVPYAGGRRRSWCGQGARQS